MTSVQSNTEKITVTIPHELKEQLVSLKKEMRTSMSQIYKEALQAFVAEKERQHWITAAKNMQKHYTVDNELKEWIEFEEDIHDHPSS